MKLESKILSIINKRGYIDEVEIAEYISDKPQKTYDPFLLLNMEEGVDLVLSSIENGERICIYGDYDSDGITSTAIMLEVLSYLTNNLSYYIPSRFDEGYGLNMKAMDKIKAAGVDLIITVDCGSVSVDEVEYAESIGLKILVTDHHKVSDKKVNCLLINPTQPGCQYPFKALAGCGVAFKFCQALANVAGLPKSSYNSTLDLVAVGTIGDIVPLIDENRTFVKYGLKLVNSGKRPALKGLIEAIGLELGKVKSHNISFGIVPHLNAAGRIKEAKLGVQLFRSKSDEEISQRSLKLKECNAKRRTVQDETYEECINVLMEKYSEDNFFVIDLPNAHEGITGIVAGKIKETWDRPTIILTPTEDGYYKGTGRSVDKVNLYDILKENEEMFVRFGGHKAACGFTLKSEYIDLLRTRLNERIDNMLLENPRLLEKAPEADLDMDPGEVSTEFIKQLEIFEPTGCANPKPKIEIRGKVEKLASMGKQGQYRRFNLVGDLGSVPCVMFKDAEKYDEELASGFVGVVGTPNLQNWNGKTSSQVLVEFVYID